MTTCTARDLERYADSLRTLAASAPEHARRELLRDAGVLTDEALRMRERDAAAAARPPEAPR